MISIDNFASAVAAQIGAFLPGDLMQSPELLPTAAQTQKAIMETFYASLLYEEGEVVRPDIIVINGDPSHASKFGAVTIFAEPKEFRSAVIAKYLPLMTNGCSILVTPTNEQLAISGIVKVRHRFASSIYVDPWLSVAAARPGSIQTSLGGVEQGRYKAGHVVPAFPPLLFSRENFAWRKVIGNPLDGVDTLICDQAIHEIAVSIARSGHGSLVLFSGEDDPGGIAENRFSAPVDLGVTLMSLIGSASSSGPEPTADEQLSAVNEERLVNDMLAVLGRFASIDGAVLLDSSLAFIAFGIRVPSKDIAVAKLKIVKPRLKESPFLFDLGLRGTRHSAAAAFAARDSRNLALITSHDGEQHFVFWDGTETIYFWPFTSGI